MVPSGLNSVPYYGQNLDFPSTVGPILPTGNLDYHLRTSDPNLTTAVFFKNVDQPPQTYPLPCPQLCAYKLHNWRFLTWFQAKMIVHLLLKCKHDERKINWISPAIFM